MGEGFEPEAARNDAGEGLEPDGAREGAGAGDGAARENEDEERERECCVDDARVRAGWGVAVSRL